MLTDNCKEFYLDLVKGLPWHLLSTHKQPDGLTLTLSQICRDFEIAHIPTIESTFVQDNIPPEQLQPTGRTTQSASVWQL